MCHLLYLACDLPLPTSAWDKDDRKAHLMDARPQDGPVPAVFAGRRVYYAGSDLGCGCGFAGNEWEDPDDRQVQAAVSERQANYVQLAHILREAGALAGRLELYMCWDGDEALPAQRLEEAGLVDIEARGFQMSDHLLLKIRP